MFSQTTEYAIRAAIEIARIPAGESILAANLAERLDLPQHYLAKILQQLVRARVLTSSRGRNGGFSLAAAPEKIALQKVVAPFEDLQKCEECILGQEICSDDRACPLHDFWKDVRNRYMRELEEKTLDDLAKFAAGEGPQKRRTDRTASRRTR